MTATSSNEGNATPGRFDSTVLSTIRALMRDPGLRRARLIIGVGLVAGLTELLNLGFYAGCGVMSFQSVVVPMAVGYLTLASTAATLRESRLSNAIAAGTVSGGAIAVFGALIGPIRYFALGGRNQLFAADGLPVPPITFGGVMAVVYANIYILVGSVIVSALAGLVGGVVGRHALSRQRRLDAAQSE